MIPVHLRYKALSQLLNLNGNIEPSRLYQWPLTMLSDTANARQDEPIAVAIQQAFGYKDAQPGMTKHSLSPDLLVPPFSESDADYSYTNCIQTLLNCVGLVSIPPVDTCTDGPEIPIAFNRVRKFLQIELPRLFEHDESRQHRVSSSPALAFIMKSAALVGRLNAGINSDIPENFESV